MKKVLIYGFYGLDNLGDDYMMLCIERLFLSKNIIPVYFKRQNEQYYFQDIEHINLFEFPLDFKYKNKFIKLVELFKWYFNKENIKDLSAIVFMGGGYTNEKFGIYNLLKMFLLCKKFKRKKIYFTGQTVGPVNSLLAKFLLYRIYKSGDFIVVREKKSKEYLDNRKIKNYLVGDDAFLTNGVKYRDKDIIIFNYKDFYGYEKYADNYFHNLLLIAKKIDREVYIVPFNSLVDSLEYKKNLELYYYLKDHGVCCKFVVLRDTLDLFQLFSRAILVIGSAYHFIVLGLLFGANVYSVYSGDYYEMKIKGILDWYGISDTHCMDMSFMDKCNFSNLVFRFDKIKNQKKITQSIKDDVFRVWNDISDEIKEL